jgi:hypothetical protein
MPPIARFQLGCLIAEGLASASMSRASPSVMKPRNNAGDKYRCSAIDADPGHALDHTAGNTAYRGTGGSEALRFRLAWMCSSAAVKGATSSSGSGSKNNFLTNMR